MSYGWWEAEQCINETEGTIFLSNCSALHIPNSKVYVARTNIEFMKLGLVGHTLLAASGDDGVDGTHGTSDNCESQNPIFPAASPYVLSVGATSIEPSINNMDLSGAPPICTQQVYMCNCSTSTNEQVCLQNNTGGFDTGGGFSQYAKRPIYQNNAVTGYLSSGIALPSTQYYNPANRGFPDVAAVGENVCVLDPGTSCGLIGGTSASTPLWGSIITFLNQDRLNAGKTPLGFVNPIIYKMYDTAPNTFFNSKMHIGNNAGECEGLGFNAVDGWDPLTGCGSPKFPAIRKYIATLP
jgi:tripeptidyl-peptidase-1